MLRLPRHRATTAQVCSAYPFQAEAGLGPRGVYLGTDVLSGGAGFAYDPFEGYATGLVTNPNMLVAGEPGTGKSAAVKCLLHRSVGVFGRWAAIADPKGEYGALAEALGLSVIKLHPGGSARINPLDPGPRGGVEGADERARRQATMVGALVGSVLRRELEPVEDAALGWALLHLARAQGPVPTLADVAALLSDPTAEMAARARTTPEALAHSVEAATYALGKLLDRSLRGMFDGPTTVALDWDGPGLVLDLSAVHHDPEALAVVMGRGHGLAPGRVVLSRPGPHPGARRGLEPARLRAHGPLPAVVLEAGPGLGRGQPGRGASAVGPTSPGRRRQRHGQGGGRPAG